jgi:hypothetical protein
MVELYLHLNIHLQGAVLNELKTGKPYFFYLTLLLHVS